MSARERTLRENFLFPYCPTRKPDINEEINKLFNVRLIGPETLDGTGTRL